MSKLAKLYPDVDEQKLMEELNGELFNMVQGDQGEAHVSDANYARDLPEFFQFVEAQRAYSRDATRKMTAFLRKYRNLRRRVEA
jgi:hypothetical protein